MTTHNPCPHAPSVCAACADALDDLAFEPDPCEGLFVWARPLGPRWAS